MGITSVEPRTPLHRRGVAVRCGRRCFSAHAALIALLAALTTPVAAAEPSSPAVRPPPSAAASPAQPPPAATVKKSRPRQPDSLIGHGGPIKALVADPGSGVVLSGSFDYAMMVWDTHAETPKLRHRLDDHDGAVNAVALVPGAAPGAAPTRALAGGDDGKIAVWDIVTGKLLHRFEGHTAKVVGLAVSSDGRWAASASWDRSARLWDLAANKAGPVLEGHTGPVNAVAFSADGAHVYTASYDGAIRAFRTADGGLLRPVHKHGWGINVLLRLPDSSRLAFGTLNGDAGIIDPASGEIAVALPPSTRPILAISAIAKPGLLALGGADGTIRIVRSGDGSPIEDYQNPYGPVWALALRGDGTSLYFGGLDDVATLWRISPRAAFDPVPGTFPRRFQKQGEGGDLRAEGEIQFARKCSVCHTLGPETRNRAGPSLHRIFGRRIATLPGYPYSAPLKDLDIVWTEETVAKLFELGPDVFTPGSKMPLQKMTDPRQRDALIAYLRVATQAGTPQQAAPPAGAPAVDGEDAKRQGPDQKGDVK